MTENQESKRASSDVQGAAAAVPRLIGEVWSDKDKIEGFRRALIETWFLLSGCRGELDILKSLDEVETGAATQVLNNFRICQMHRS